MNLRLHKVDTVLDEITQTHNEIMQRAYQIFSDRGCTAGHALDDWLAAEHESVWKPAIELSRNDDVFTVEAAIAGVDPRDLDVQVTPDSLLIRAETRHKHDREDWTVGICEFAEGRLFRSISFPEKVNPSAARAEYRHGLLRVTVPVAPKMAPKKVEVEFAVAHT